MKFQHPILTILLASLAGLMGACRGSSTGFQHQPSAGIVETVQDLIGGPAAQAQPGDFLLKNQYVRVIIQQITSAPNMLGGYGGNIIDADITRRPDSQGHDQLRELVFWHNLGRGAQPTQIRIADDGRLTGNAIIEVIAEDVRLPGIANNAVESAINDNPSAPIIDAIDPDQAISLEIRTRYSLGPEDQAVKIETFLVSQSSASVNLAVGDLIQVLGDSSPFISANQGIVFGSSSHGFGLSDQPGEVGYNGVEYMGWESDNVSYAYSPETRTLGRLDGQTTCLHLAFATGCIAGATLSTLDGLQPVANTWPDQSSGFLKVPVKGQGIASFQRFFAVGNGDLSDATSGLSRMRNEKITPVFVSIADPSGIGQENADIAVLTLNKDGNYVPWTHAKTSDNGTAMLELGDGPFILVTQKEAHLNNDVSGIPSSFSIPADRSDVTGITINAPVGSSGIAEFFTRDHLGNAVPANITILGEEASPAALYVKGETLGLNAGTGDIKIFPFRDLVSDPLPAGLPEEFALPVSLSDGSAVSDVSVIAVVHTDGQGAVRTALEPGTYIALASRGPAYALSVKRFEVTANQTIRTVHDLFQVVNTFGMAQADFSLKSRNSPGHSNTAQFQIQTAAAAGLDFVSLADNNYVTLIPAESSNLPIAVESGIQINEPGIGSFLLSPIVQQSIPIQTKPGTGANESFLPKSLDGGAPIWLAADGLTRKSPVNLLTEVIPTLTANMLFSLPVPSSGLFDNLDLSFDLALGYDPDNLDGGAIQTLSELPAVEAGPYYTDDWHTIEIAPGLSGMAGIWTELNTAFAFWNLGRRSVLIGGSQSGQTSRSGAGSTRTFVSHPTDDSAELNHTVAGIHDLVRSGLKLGMATVSNGPLISLSVAGILVTSPTATTPIVTDIFEAAPIGELLSIDRNKFPGTGTDFSVTLTATIVIQSPTWIEPSHVDLFLNAPSQENTDSNSTGSFLSSVTEASWAITTTQLASALTQSTLTVIDETSGAVTTMTTDGKRYEITLQYERVISAATLVSTSLTDLWFAARVTGTRSLYPVVIYPNETATPFAIANPVFVDLGGDAGDFNVAFDGPCEQAAAPDCPSP